jgi:RNA polymerase-binding transcription factor DksA
MDQEQLEQFRQRLLSEKSLVLKQLEQLEQESRETVAGQAEEGIYETGAASAVFEEERILGERKDLLAHLEELNQAFKRIELGTYGFSEVSGLPIPLERLEVLPWATRRVEEAQSSRFARRA